MKKLINFIVGVIVFTAVLLFAAWLLFAYPAVAAWGGGIILAFILLNALCNPNAFKKSNYQMRREHPELFKDKS